ncbi:hypothetical protein RN001_007726 [Aquatica leii]|uniref:Uncharacterized protein n=1 Tax=Aquatica leii TaxID=1421715 RepID=A0AAN7P3A1_9COLE|nr:hypothetical protein RN001_007726 [Aquatica leii]
MRGLRRREVKEIADIKDSDCWNLLVMKKGRKIKKLIKTEMEARIEVETAYKIRKQEPKIVIVKLKNFKQKMEGIKNNYKLGDNIYIDSDLTYKEQKTQAIIRKIAKEENNKPNSTKVSYKKLEINGVKYIWNEEKSKLTKN